MVVIDAEKHKLDYKKSEQDNGITALKKKYQAHENDDGYGGAATLISRAKSETSVLKRKGSPIIDKETGEQSWKTVREEYVDKNGRTQVRTQKSTKMAETRDARTLSSGTPQEEAYADYANTMKALANQARKEMISSGKIAYSASAKQTYQVEVDSLMSKLNVALKNAPRERQAQTMANSIVAAKKKDNPDMTKAEIKKANQQALTAARTSKVVYSGKTLIDLTEDTITEETLLRGYTAHKADGTKIVGTAFKDYPSRYSFLDTLQDSKGENILDKANNVIQGETVYKKV